MMRMQQFVKDEMNSSQRVLDLNYTILRPISIFLILYQAQNVNDVTLTAKTQWHWEVTQLQNSTNLQQLRQTHKNSRLSKWFLLLYFPDVLLLSTLYHLWGVLGFISSAGLPSNTMKRAQHWSRFSYSIIEII